MDFKEKYFWRFKRIFLKKSIVFKNFGLSFSNCHSKIALLNKELIL